MSRRALFLVNRQASQAQQNLDQAFDQLRALGLELFEESPDSPRGLSDLIRRYRDRVDLVVIGGGDGSLNAAADGLVDSQAPLGILPLGTANDLARTLGIPTDLAGACRVIAAGHTRRIDLGWVNGKHFFNVASIGLTVAIAEQLSKKTKSRWGVLAYLLTAARVAWKARPFRAEIRCGDGTLRTKTVQIAVGNGRHYGGGMTVAADATIDDGMLDLYSLEVEHWWQLIPLLPALRQGSLASWPRARTLRGTEFQVSLRRPRAVNTDGEITTHTPATFRLVRRALSVLVPGPGPQQPDQESAR